MDVSSTSVKQHPSEGTATSVDTTDRPNAAYVTDLRDNDVLYGRGQPILQFPGNLKFRKLIQDNKAEYTASGKHVVKNEIARRILSLIAESRGRFLRKIEDDDEREALNIPDAVLHAWVEVDESARMQKVKQALRELSKSETDRGEMQGSQRRKRKARAAASADRDNNNDRRQSEVSHSSDTAGGAAESDTSSLVQGGGRGSSVGLLPPGKASQQQVGVASSWRLQLPPLAHQLGHPPSSLSSVAGYPWPGASPPLPSTVGWNPSGAAAAAAGHLQTEHMQLQHLQQALMGTHHRLSTPSYDLLMGGNSINYPNIGLAAAMGQQQQQHAAAGLPADREQILNLLRRVQYDPNFAASSSLSQQQQQIPQQQQATTTNNHQHVILPPTFQPPQPPSYESLRHFLPSNSNTPTYPPMPLQGSLLPPSGSNNTAHSEAVAVENERRLRDTLRIQQYLQAQEEAATAAVSGSTTTAAATESSADHRRSPAETTAAADDGSGGDERPSNNDNDGDKKLSAKQA